MSAMLVRSDKHYTVPYIYTDKMLRIINIPKVERKDLDSVIVIFFSSLTVPFSTFIRLVRLYACLNS